MANPLEKLQQVSDELGSHPGTISVPFTNIEKIKIRQQNLVILQNVLSGSNSFILGHAVNGKLGTATALGGGQIVLGLSGSQVKTEILRRRYDWDNTGELSKGEKTSNVDISQGFIQLGNVTIRNIYLEHKQKS